MMQAITAIYPKSRLQRCIVRRIRSSTRYASYKDIKQVAADLKKIYAAVTLDQAEENLRAFAVKWRKQYPSCVKSWEENWEVLSTFSKAQSSWETYSAFANTHGGIILLGVEELADKSLRTVNLPDPDKLIKQR